jgi:hypothetical protein
MHGVQLESARDFGFVDGTNDRQMIPCHDLPICAAGLGGRFSARDSRG